MSQLRIVDCDSLLIVHLVRTTTASLWQQAVTSGDDLAHSGRRWPENSQFWFAWLVECRDAWRAVADTAPALIRYTIQYDRRV